MYKIIKVLNTSYGNKLECVSAWSSIQTDCKANVISLKLYPEFEGTTVEKNPQSYWVKRI